MKRLKDIAWSVIFVVLCMGTPSLWAQGGAHTMVTPGDLKWVDVPSLPPGAKFAVIEGPLNEAVPFTFRLRLPSDYKFPAHSHSAIEHVTHLGHVPYGCRRQPRSNKNQTVIGWKRRHHAAKNESLRMDERRDNRSGTWGRTLDYQLRQTRRRRQEEMMPNPAA
jgi:hypothetical protein